MRDLLELRDEIDTIDNEIVALFDKQREDSKLETLSAKVDSSFLKYGVRELFEQIMATSRKRQYQLLAENGMADKTDFVEIEKMDYSGARIVFQGAEGAYSQLALKEYFGNSTNSYNVETWRDAMEAIKNGEADYAVLPIENSSAGIVSENYDLMVEYDNCIVGEQIIKIDHVLMGLPDAELSDITEVYSHPQALMQCSKYLDSHREWETHSFINTAMASQKIKEDGKKHKAAIASKLTADIYGLKVLKEAIQDNTNNYTRFIIVAAKKVFEKKAEKISICFEIPHEKGTLYHKLSHFIYNGINMNKIESRPVQGKAWEYRFFVDFEGNLNDAAVQNALRGLKEETSRLKILGNY